MTGLHFSHVQEQAVVKWPRGCTVSVDISPSDPCFPNIDFGLGTENEFVPPTDNPLNPSRRNARFTTQLPVEVKRSHSSCVWHAVTREEKAFCIIVAAVIDQKTRSSGSNSIAMCFSVNYG